MLVLSMERHVAVSLCLKYGFNHEILSIVCIYGNEMIVNFYRNFSGKTIRAVA